MDSSLGLATALEVALGKSSTSLNLGSMISVQLILRLQPLHPGRVGSESVL